MVHGRLALDSKVLPLFMAGIDLFLCVKSTQLLFFASAVRALLGLALIGGASLFYVCPRLFLRVRLMSQTVSLSIHLSPPLLSPLSR